MLLINYEINLILTWSNKFVLSNTAAQTITFEKSDTKFYIPVVTLSTQDKNININQIYIKILCEWLKMNFFDKPAKNNLRTYDNIWKIAAGQRDDFTTGCLLDYKYFNKHYNMTAINLNNENLAR